jgi:hypothetical protein
LGGLLVWLGFVFSVFSIFLFPLGKPEIWFVSLGYLWWQQCSYRSINTIICTYKWTILHTSLIVKLPTSKFITHTCLRTRWLPC